MTDKEGHFQIVHKKRVMSRKESALMRTVIVIKKQNIRTVEGRRTGTERGCGPASAKTVRWKKH